MGPPGLVVKVQTQGFTPGTWEMKELPLSWSCVLFPLVLPALSPPHCLVLV